MGYDGNFGVGVYFCIILSALYILQYNIVFEYFLQIAFIFISIFWLGLAYLCHRFDMNFRKSCDRSEMLKLEVEHNFREFVMDALIELTKKKKRRR